MYCTLFSGEGPVGVQGILCRVWLQPLSLCACEKSWFIPSYYSSLRDTGVFTEDSDAKSEVLTAVLMEIYLPECYIVPVDKYCVSP